MLLTTTEAKTMIDIRVTFKDGNTITTGFNGTLADAIAYYLGKFFNFGDTWDCPHDKMVRAIKVEQL